MGQTQPVRTYRNSTDTGGRSRKSGLHGLYINASRTHGSQTRPLHGSGSLGPSVGVKTCRPGAESRPGHRIKTCKYPDHIIRTYQCHASKTDISCHVSTPSQMAHQQELSPWHITLPHHHMSQTWPTQHFRKRCHVSSIMDSSTSPFRYTMPCRRAMWTVTFHDPIRVCHVSPVVETQQTNVHGLHCQSMYAISSLVGDGTPPFKRGMWRCPAVIDGVLHTDRIVNERRSFWYRPCGGNIPS